jgi:hypothetical protein
MTVSLRAVFQEPDVDLRQTASSLDLDAPVSLRQLVAADAIQEKWLKNDGGQGPLGVATSTVQSSDAGSFTQNFRGGDLRFTSDGSVNRDTAYELQVGFRGIHCFGQPGFLESDNVYAIITLYGLEQNKLKVWALPGDSSDNDHWDNLEEGEDRTFGNVTLKGIPAPTTPQPITLNSVIVRCSGSGSCHADGTKKVVLGIATGAGVTIGTIVGAGVFKQPKLGATAGAAAGALIGELIDGALFDDKKIGDANHTFTMEQISALGPVDSQSSGPIQFNYMSDIITDGDASYRLYFNLQVLEIKPAPPLK